MPDTSVESPALPIVTGATSIATAVLADSAVEHHRGSFHNPVMWLPLVGSGLSIAASTGGACRWCAAWGSWRGANGARWSRAAASPRSARSALPARGRTVGGADPSLTIQATACRTTALAARGEL